MIDRNSRSSTRGLVPLRKVFLVPKPEKFDVPLSKDERDLLAQGLLQWDGPATCTEELAVAIGFKSVDGLRIEAKRICGDLRDLRPLSQLDWTRTLLSTEIMFASDMMGAGVEWPTVTRFSDEETIVLLRGLQRKLIKYQAQIGTHHRHQEDAQPGRS